MVHNQPLRLKQAKVGGGPKTIPADKFIFCGNIGSGFLILTSQAKLDEPNESFYTSSSHRLRDSHVGRDGHWVDIEVFGRASNEALATIERLAQVADAGPMRTFTTADLNKQVGKVTEAAVKASVFINPAARWS